MRNNRVRATNFSNYSNKKSFFRVINTINGEPLIKQEIT